MYESKLTLSTVYCENFQKRELRTEYAGWPSIVSLMYTAMVQVSLLVVPF